MENEFEREWTQDPAAALDLHLKEETEFLDETKLSNGDTLRPNDGVELTEGRFMRVTAIIEDVAGAVSLCGIMLLLNIHVDKKFSRTLGHYLKSWLPRKQNELCAVIKTTTNSDAMEAGLTQEPLENVVRKRHIIFTNTTYPCRAQLNTLVCRWKYIERGDLATRKVADFQFRRLTQSESDLECGLSSYWLLEKYRPGKDLPSHPEPEYMYADMCAGGGGTTQAAVLAGLRPKILLDNDVNACATLARNFGPELVVKRDVGDFAQQKDGSFIVHVLHLSFVCKPHSGLNRGQNPERDALFIALGYCLSELLRVCKPRIVTMEQVPGILTRSYEGQHFRSYIQALTEAGYDCRWRVVNFSHYGNVQARKRLIVMASCPGQSLPRWPRPTNGNEPGLLDPVTLEDALLLVPDTELLPTHMKRHTKKLNVRHPDANRPLPACITCSGGETDVHPFEERSFNMAELAVLNGFPAWHKFPDDLGVTALRTLIGNAVPALSFQYFFREAVRALRRTDYELRQHEQYDDRELID